MHYDATRRLDLLRTVSFELLTSPTCQSGIRAVVASVVAGEVGCPKNV
jgi:hypothetical protein